MDSPYSWVNTRCANNGRTYTIPIPIPWRTCMVKVRFANFNSFLSYSVSLYPNEKCLTDHWNPYVI